MNPNLLPANACPEHFQLLALAEGTLSDEEASTISEHVAQCHSCDTRLGAIEEQSDDLVRALAMLPATPADEETFQALQAELLAHPEEFGGEEIEATTEAFRGQRFRWDVPPAVSLPIQLGNYELLEQIGAGANGAVFRARHRRLEKQVAIKLLLNVAGSAVEEFLNEMRIIGQLEHPNVITATDAGEYDGIYFLVMEYVPGLDVSSLLRKVGPLSVADACEITRQAALGLSVAHQSNLVHRDVKTSNLLFTSSGQVKLLDLGLATIAARPNESTHHSSSSGPRGTADYMAPEQWRQSSQVTAKADIYSLGCTLYKLLTGAPPFHPLPSDVASLEEAHLHSDVPALANHTQARIPSHLESYLQSLLAKDPQDRPESASEVAASLERYASGSNLFRLARRVFPQAEVPPTPRALLKSSSKTTRRVAIAAALAGLGALVWKVNHPSPTQTRIQANQWRPLTTTAPTIIPLPKKAPGSEGDAPPPEPQLTTIEQGVRVVSAYPVLIHFGKPMTGVFRYRVKLAHESASGSAGIFFRLRSSPDGGYQFHTLEIVKSDAVLSLTWKEYSSSSMESPVPLAGRDIPGSDTIAIAVEVGLGSSGFPQFIVNDQRLSQSQWTFSKDGRALITSHSRQIASTYMGHIGVFHSQGSTTIQSPELMYV